MNIETQTAQGRKPITAAELEATIALCDAIIRRLRETLLPWESDKEEDYTVLDAFKAVCALVKSADEKGIVNKGLMIETKCWVGPDAKIHNLDVERYRKTYPYVLKKGGCGPRGGVVNPKEHFLDVVGHVKNMALMIQRELKHDEMTEVIEKRNPYGIETPWRPARLALAA